MDTAHAVATHAWVARARATPRLRDAADATYGSAAICQTGAARAAEHTTGNAHAASGPRRARSAARPPMESTSAHAPNTPMRLSFRMSRIFSRSKAPPSASDVSASPSSWKAPVRSSDAPTAPSAAKAPPSGSSARLTHPARPPRTSPTSGKCAGAHRQSSSEYGKPPTGSRVRKTNAARAPRSAGHGARAVSTDGLPFTACPGPRRRSRRSPSPPGA
jgi:hypothetical protein